MKSLANPEFINFLPGLPPQLVENLKTAAQKSRANNIAIVGGVVRDYLIHIFHGESLKKYQDIDIVVEGSAKKLASEIEFIVGEQNISIHQPNQSFDSVQVTLKDIVLDISTARKEIYHSPGENPEVQSTTLQEDLGRRDFTINSIALDLFNNKLIDLFNGINDIKSRHIRFIHKNSVKEDPTRIIRGARYASRLDFTLDIESLEQVKSTINAWPWEWVISNKPLNAPTSLSSRLRMEIELLLEKEPWEKAIYKLQKWGALVLLDQNIQRDLDWEIRIRWARKLNVKPLTALIAIAKDPFGLSLRLHLASKQQFLLKEAIELKLLMEKLNEENDHKDWGAWEWCNRIEIKNWDKEAISILICLRIPLWKILYRWSENWRLIKSNITAQDLVREGWEPGPEIGIELKRLRIIELKKLNSNKS